MAIRSVKRVSEEYIQDPVTGLYYWLAPIFKKGSEQQLLDDMNAMVDRLNALPSQGEQVRRPTAMILKSAMETLQPTTQARLGENTYLMLFDPGADKPAEIPDGTFSKEWVSEGNNIFLWSSNDKVYTWCDSNALGHRYFRVAEDVALADAFQDPETPPVEDPTVPPVTPPVYAPVPEKWHITGKIAFLNVDLTVEAVDE